MNRVIAYLSVTLILVAVGLLAIGQTNGLYIFQSGDPIVADEVNHNFAYVEGQIEANLISKFFGGQTPEVSGGTGAECTLGDVWLTASTVGGGTPAQGQLLSITQNTALFSLLGNLYGGDGQTTFALPDLRNVAPQSANGQALTYLICTEGIFPERTE
jgi:hypothetical protein